MLKIEAAIEKAILHRSNGILITETFDLAKKQASDALKKKLNPFPLVVKDCFTVKDDVTTCASKMLENYVPSYTATVVDRLVEKGGCIIGKANHDEFSMGTSSALGHFGPVKSGLSSSAEDWLIPGGSSGGPAVAVQLGIAEIALASDTGGSTRNPAAFNGIFGLKPTYGVLSRNGLIPLVNSLDAPSILTNSASDCWKFLEIMSGTDSKDSTSIDLPCLEETKSVNGLKIGIPMEYHNEYLSEEGWRWWNRAVNVLRQNGASILPITLPHTKYSLSCYHVLAASDITSNMARYDSVAYGHRSKDPTSTYELYATSRGESLNQVVRRRIFAGNYFLMKKIRKDYFERALKVRRKINDEILDAFNKVDVIITPTASGAAPLFSKLRESLFSREDDDDYFTQAANLAGVPSISVPIGQTSEGLPIGVQLMTNRLRDRLACDVAACLYSYVTSS